MFGTATPIPDAQSRCTSFTYVERFKITVIVSLKRCSDGGTSSSQVDQGMRLSFLSPEWRMYTPRCKFDPLQVRPRPRRRKAYGQRALRPRERSLLRLLHLNPGITFSRECIASLIWGLDEVGLRTVDTTVSRIREVFLQHDLCNPIRGVVGRGYQINGHGVGDPKLVLPQVASSTNP
jgi:Transcriptional regulatory protein, C terminal